MNPDYRELGSASDRALKNWKKSIPVNREARRNQLSKYKYYLELNETSDTWSVNGVRKNGVKFLIDSSVNHEPKITEEKPQLIEDIVEHSTPQTPEKILDAELV